jgi:sigma-B regulation protein RsbU (phosphoserine phosphatase)
MNKRRLVLGILFFALMFFYVGAHAYFLFFHVGSYDGWTANKSSVNAPAIIVSVDPNGPGTALQKGDEFLSINGITSAQDPDIINYNRRVPPGTTYSIAVRRDGQELLFSLKTAPRPATSSNFIEKSFVFTTPIFLITGLIVFLLKPDNQQARLLALMLGTFAALNAWLMPVKVLGEVADYLIALAKILGLWSLPLFVRFFLNFPERSPVLRRWPRLEKYLDWPFYLFVLPYLGGYRLPSLLRDWYFGLKPIAWLSDQIWSKAAIPMLMAYLAAGLIALIISYRVASHDAKRRLRVVVFGSGVGFLLLLLVIAGNFLGMSERYPRLDAGLEYATLIAIPFIPLSFAYAIIRHKVIPVSLIIRRSARYVLVSRGSAVLIIASVCLIMFFVMDAVFRYTSPKSGRVVGIISAVLAIIVWNLVNTFHRRVIAPLIDRHFFREAYDARQILADLSQSVRSTTDSRQLLEMVCTRIQKALHVENLTVFLRDEESGDYRHAITFDHQSDHPIVSSADDLRLPAEAGVVQRLSESGEPLGVDLHELSPSFPQRDLLERLNTALLLPLAAKGQLLGVISLGARLGDQPFSREDEQMLMSVAGQTSFALENIRLIGHMIEDARHRRELEAENEQRAKELEEARQLQLSMLPKKLPQLPDLEIAAYMKTAAEVGGDYYDFHLAEDGTLTVAVGDATGHGLKAGTMVTAAKSLFEAFAHERDLVRIFQQTSCALKRMNMRSLFMAMTIVRVKGHRLTVSTAGMPPVLIYRAASGNVEEVAIRGIPLGSMTNYPYKQQVIDIGAGDVVALMSDGLPERFNVDNEMLDYPSTKRAFAVAARESPQAIIDHFVNTGEKWAAGRPQDDDVTFVVLKVKNGSDNRHHLPIESFQ